jgi:hypothetical protein
VTARRGVTCRARRTRHHEGIIAFDEIVEYLRAPASEVDASFGFVRPRDAIAA